MVSAFVGFGVALVATFALLFLTWGWNAIRDTRRRHRKGERYMSFRELLAPRKPAPLDRLFDWFNETAERVVPR